MDKIIKKVKKHLDKDMEMLIKKDKKLDKKSSLREKRKKVR